MLLPKGHWVSRADEGEADLAPVRLLDRVATRNIHGAMDRGPGGPGV